MMFCDIHGCLLVMGECPECSVEDSASFRAENGCEQCGCSDFVGAKEGLLSCKECKTEHEKDPGRDGFVRRAYTSVYHLFQRNHYHPYFWAKDRTTSEIIYVLEVHEKPTGISRWNISDGVFIAKYDHGGKEIPILRTGKGGKKYRPYVSGNYLDSGVDRSPLPKNYGFMLGEEFDDDWRMIDEPFKEPPFNQTFQEIIDMSFHRYHERGSEMATEKQKAYLSSKRLGYTGDLENLTRGQARNLITKLSGKG
tara:strand:+ start:3895 stop:4650 length:756 start_codon:yes stop_codon:yes gene_type:complete